MVASIHTAQTKGLLLAREATGREQQLQQQEVQVQKHKRWLISQAPPNGSVPATTNLSYVGRPWELVVQAGHEELHQQQHVESPEVQAQSGTSFASHNQGGL